MAAQEYPDKQKDNPHNENEQHVVKLMSSYLGLSLAVFLGLSPSLLSSLERKNRALSCKLIQAEEQLQQLHSRRREDSKANARVAEIFATHRHAWQQEEKRLLHQIDEGNQEISYLKGKIGEFERLEAEMRTSVEGLKREIEDNTSGVSKGSGVDESGFSSDFLNSWSVKPTFWQDMQQHESHESVNHSQHFVARRRESPWKDEGVSTGLLAKLKLLEQELVNLERIGDPDLSELELKLHKQAKRYQALAGKIDNLCKKMKASDQHGVALSSDFQTQRHTEFLLEAFRLQQHATEINDKLAVLHTEARKICQQDEVEGLVKVGTKVSLITLRTYLKEIQRGLEIWLARIIGDLEGTLAREGASRVREYYMSKYPFVQS